MEVAEVVDDWYEDGIELPLRWLLVKCFGL